MMMMMMMMEEVRGVEDEGQGTAERWNDGEVEGLGLGLLLYKADLYENTQGSISVASWTGRRGRRRF